MYKSIMLCLLSFLLCSSFTKSPEPVKNDGGQQRQFLEFLSFFEKVSLPYVFDLQTIECSEIFQPKKSTKMKMGKEDPKFIKAAKPFLLSTGAVRFSRMGRPEIYPVARFFPDDKTVAIVYCSKQRFTGFANKNYMLACYDLKGNLLGKDYNKGSKKVNHQDIGFTNYQKTQTFTIFPSGKIKTVLYDNHWVNEVGTKLMEENELLGFKKVKAVTYELAGARGIKEIGYTEIAARP